MIAITTLSKRYKPSTAAALAGAIESAIYGGLLKTPAVYILLSFTFGTTRTDKRQDFYVSHRRAENMRVTSRGAVLLDTPSSCVSQEKGLEIWEQAREKSRDEAP
jgi:hypothetical protein